MNRFAVVVALAFVAPQLSVLFSQSVSEAKEVAGAGNVCNQVRDTPNCGNAGTKTCLNSYPVFKNTPEGMLPNSFQLSTSNTPCFTTDNSCLQKNVNFKQNDPNCTVNP